MKKAFCTLLTLCSLVFAAEPTAVWETSDLPLSGHATYDITLDKGVTLNTTNGMTAMFTVNWAGISTAPMLWFTTTDGSAYTNSVATFGYKGNVYHAALYNNTSGSAGNMINGYDNGAATTAKTPDYLTSFAEGDSKIDSLKDKQLVYFITSQNGISKLYTRMDDGSIQLISTHPGMKTGNIGKMYIGHWNDADSHQLGTLTYMAVYNTVLTEEQMKDLTTCKPAIPLLPIAAAALALLGLAVFWVRRKKQ